MNELFLTIINMSISASWLILAVLILRLVLKKAPKWVNVLLWGIVAMRLLFPFPIESALSLIPSAETIPIGIEMDTTPAIDSGINAINSVVNPTISQSNTPAVGASINPLQITVAIFAYIWVFGVAALLIYTAVGYWRLRKKISTAVIRCDNIFQSENVVSPFVLGIIKPKIYLPFKMSGQDMEHVVAHEQAHIRRRDHWWKPVGFVLLTLHWFNPFMWLGYVLLCRDIESACDEKVIKKLGSEQRADYSQALLSCSVSRRSIAACPLAFGEAGVKERIKNVLNYKKPAFWVIVVAVIACIVVAVCFLTNPYSSKSLSGKLGASMDMAVAEHNSSGREEVNFIATDYNVLSIKKTLGKTTVYAWVLYEEFSYDGNDIKLESGSHIPTAITFDTASNADASSYEVIEYWEPRDGSYYADDIRDKFPWYLYSKAIDSQRYIKEQQANCERMAQEYFDSVANVGGVDNPTTITMETVDKLKEKYPQYFGLSTAKGLEVYVWQMAENSFSCGLLPGTNRVYLKEELWDLHKASASMDEMRTIVASYNLPPSDVVICPIAMPHSSYLYTMDDAYRTKIEEMFWSDFPVIQQSEYSPMIDTAMQNK